jgi:hypothetical protein
VHKIVIYINEKAIITGILFYCIEHFLYLSKFTDIQLCVIYNGDLNTIKGIIKEKYVILNKQLENVVQIKPLDLIKHSAKKIMVLDTDTYNMIQNFLGKTEKVFLYSNDNNHNARDKDIVYGFYKHQKYQIKERFKIGFQFMKPKIPHLDKTFCSFLLHGIKVINKKRIEEIATYDVIYKNFNEDLDIFEFKEIIYYHTRYLDRNNRLIPETFYFGNKLTLINNENTDDSVNERYHACLTGGVEQFQIDENYKVTKDFLEY